MMTRACAGLRGHKAMSEGVHASPDAPHRGLNISNPRDFYGGLSLVLLRPFAMWASRDLPGMHRFAFGPGPAPRLVALIPIALGAALTAGGLFVARPDG